MAWSEKEKKGGGPRIGRREFMAGAGAAALAMNIVKPSAIFGAEANSKVELGLIGCGGRGTWIANLFKQHGGYQLVAGADYFEDKVNAFGDKFGVDSSRRYTGLNGYKKLLESGVDAVAIISPPYFHPEQAAAGVDAGVHVYVAKPIGVDVPGCLTIGESGAKARARNQCFLVDFQTRTHPYYKEAVKRVQYGQIGPIVNGEASYIAGIPWGQYMNLLRQHPNDPEVQLRAWGLSRTLSGDIITEQNIHALDVAAWILEDPPVSAWGTGGPGLRDVGTCWDHFSVTYTYPEDVILTFHSKQFGTGWDDILCRMYGSKGVVDTHYFGDVSIRGEIPFKGGSVGNLYTSGAVANIATFHESIMNKRYQNPTVEPSVRSNLTTILGRTAAYRREEVTWKQMMDEKEKLEADFSGLKA